MEGSSLEHKFGLQVASSRKHLVCGIDLCLCSPLGVLLGSEAFLEDGNVSVLLRKAFEVCELLGWRLFGGGFQD